MGPIEATAAPSLATVPITTTNPAAAQSDYGWKTSLSAFVRALAQVMSRSEAITDADTQKIRSHLVLQGGQGQRKWILDGGDIPGSMQYEVSKAFADQTLNWTAVVEKVDVTGKDPLVFLQVPDDVKGLVPDLSLRVDLPKAAKPKLKPGDTAEVRGSILVANLQDIFKGVRVMEGTGVNAGKRAVIVGIQGTASSAESESPAPLPLLSSLPALPPTGWPEKTKEKVTNVLTNYTADPVSACLTFQELLKQEKDGPRGNAREWLEKAVRQTQPPALEMLERDFKTAAASRDLRAAWVAVAAAVRMKTNALPDAPAAIAKLKSDLWSGKPPAKPVWRLGQPKGTWLRGPYTEGSFNNQVTLSPKQGMQLLRVTAEVENISSTSDAPYFLWTRSGLIREMQSLFGSNKGGPQRWATDDLVFLLTPGGDLLPCSHVCEGSSLRGALTMTMFSKEGAGQSMLFGGEQVARGEKYTADVIFSVPAGLEGLRLIIFGSAPVAVALGK